LANAFQKSVVLGDAYFRQRVDDCADTVRVARDAIQLLGVKALRNNIDDGGDIVRKIVDLSQGAFDDEVLIDGPV